MTDKQPQAAPPAKQPEPSRQLRPVEEIRNVLMGPTMGQQFRMALPSHLPVEKFQRVAVTAIAQNPDLLSVERTSLYAECMKAAQDGLLPDGREGALTIFKMKRGNDWIKVAKWMPMVWGIAKKIRNSGELAMLTAHVVYQADQFSYWVDDEGEHITHRPMLDGERGNPRLVYALAKTKGEEVYIEVMTLEQIAKVMEASKSKDKDGAPVGPWRDWWPEMARKSAIRRLSKRLPMSTDKEEELRRVIERDDDLYDLNKPAARELVPAAVVPETEPKDKKKRPRRLQAVVDAEKPAPPAATPAKPAAPAERPQTTAPEHDGPPPGHPAAEPADGDVI